MKKFFSIFLTALLATLPCTPLMAQDDDEDEEYEEVDDFGYVTFSADSLTMTFYYDSLQAQRADSVGKVYSVERFYSEGYSLPEWFGDSIVSKVTTVRFDTSYVHARPTFTSLWFEGFTNLTRIDGFANLNTSEADDMSYMFSNCTSLDSIDISSFAFNKHAATTHMFKGNNRLKLIKAGSLDFGQLGSVDENVIVNNYHMFAGVGSDEAPCSLLVHDDFNYEPFQRNDSTSLYKYSGGTFSIGRYGPKTAKLERYAAFSADTTKVTFYYDTLRAQRVTNGFCLDMPDKLTAAYRKAIAKADSAWFDTSFYSALPRTTAGWFEGGKKLKSIDMGNLHTTRVTDMSRMFSGCESMTAVNLDNLCTINVTTMESMFSGCKQLKYFDARSLATSKVTNMRWMFKDCEALQKIYFNGNSFVTRNVTDMQGMLQGCRSLKELDLTRFNTDKVKYASNFLDGADSLRVLKLGRNEFYNASTTRNMFNNVGSAYADAACQLYVDTTFQLSRLEEISAPYYRWGNGKFVALVYDKQMQRTEEFRDKDGTGRVLLERYFDADTWQTLALPFALSREQVDSIYGQGTLLARLDSFTGDTLYFKTVERIEANVPIIIRPATAVAWPVFNGVTIVRDFTYNSCVIDMVGDEITAELDCYFCGYNIIQINQNLLQNSPLAAVRPYENNVIKKVKFLFNTEGSFLIYNKNGKGDDMWDDYTYYHDIPILLRSASGETTRISIPAVETNNVPRYNLAGQRVGKEYKGVIIQNGRKYVNN